VSRALDPVVAGYCWETTITLLGAGVLLGRRLACGPLASLPARSDFGWILLFCIPGAMGTACYALAVSQGPLAIVAAVLGCMMVASSILAWLIHGEKLSGGQWFFVGFVCFAVAGMRFSAG
jgi:drug/metabolite transporter (DMT)-like permease